jgi:transmembrane sensor
MDRNRGTNRPRRAWRTDEEWKRLHARISPRRRWALPVRVAQIAAALLIVASGVVVTRYAARQRALVPPDVVVSTRRGERHEIRFDDGSVITLGAASEIRYAFSARQRRVELDGLADFSVAHDSARPFTVRVRNSQITDVGTEFTVRAYPGDSHIEVAVRSGHIAWRARPDSSQQIDLGPGDAASIDSSGASAVRHGADLARYSAWMSGRLAFENQPLREVGAELSRWFDVDVVFSDTSVANRRVTAVYGDPALGGVLDALSATLGVTYKRSGRTVTLSSKAP